MRPTETRLSCLGLLAVLTLGLPMGFSEDAQGLQEGLSGLAEEGDLIAQTRACRNWYAAAAEQPRGRDWAKDAQFEGCRQVITKALEHLHQDRTRHEAVRGLAFASARDHGAQEPGTPAWEVRSQP